MATRASLSITEPNEKWIQDRIDSREFSSRSEVINDLIRKAREVEAIRARLIESELSAAAKGWVTTSRDTMLEQFKARSDGEL